MIDVGWQASSDLMVHGALVAAGFEAGSEFSSPGLFNTPLTPAQLSSPEDAGEAAEGALRPPPILL